MSSRGAVKQLAPPKKAAPAKSAAAARAGKKAAPAKAAAVKGKPPAKAKGPSPRAKSVATVAPAPKSAVKAVAPAPKPAVKSVAPAPKPAAKPVALAPKMALIAKAPAPRAAPALVHPAVKPALPGRSAPRPAVVAGHLSPPQSQKNPPPGPAAAPPRPPPAPKPQPTLARSYFFNDLRVGDDLPTLQKPPVDRVQIARYAVEAHDYNRLHLDEPYAAALGYRTVFAPGALAMGFVAQLVAQWLKRGLVRKLQARFVKIVRPGDELTCRGRVAEKRREKSACLAELELWAENQKGELVLRGHATCELLESPAMMPGEGALLTGTPRTQAPRPGQPALPKKK